jgi:NAD(P)-dependent dehydrogenase (short-subunit alcohol dehydrogenase family)
MKSLSKLGDMSGRVALVTGGAGHLGVAMGSALAELGAQIIILDLNKEQADKTAENFREKFGGEHSGLSVNLDEKKEIATVPLYIEEHFGRLDVLINCAALVGSSGLKGWAKPFKDQDVFTWEKAIDVNLTAGFYLIQQCLGLMHKSNVASIINVASIYGFAGQKMLMYEGLDYLTPAAYAASKGGLIQLTRYLATVLAPKIRVNCISPGGIERNQDKVFLERYKKLTPLARMGREEDFKGVTQFLASDLSAYVTGQNIIVDGGWSI